jgi:hypothetical protein
VLHEPDGPVHNQARAAMVDLQVDPAGQKQVLKPRIRADIGDRQP